MAFDLIKGGMWVGHMISPAGGLNGVVYTSGWGSMTTTNHRVGFVFQAPKDGTLHSFEMRPQTVTQAPSNGLKFSFQDVASTGGSDNVVDQYRVVTAGIAAATWLSPPGPLTDDGTDTGVKRTVSAGEWVACVVEFQSFVAGDSLTWSSLTSTQNQNNTDTNNYQYGISGTNAGAWNGGNVDFVCVAVRYDDGYEFVSPAHGPYSALSGNAQAFDDSSNPDEYGLRFILPFDFELCGVRVRSAEGASTGTADVKVYSSTDSLLDSFTVEGQKNNLAALSRTSYFPLTRFSPYGGGAVHRLTFKATHASNDWRLEYFDVPTNDHLDCFGGGKEWYWTQRNNDGAWTDITTRRPWIQLHLSRVNGVASEAAGRSFCFIG
jgi:hypothetical protein